VRDNEGIDAQPTDLPVETHDPDQFITTRDGAAERRG
jgi:hypothetical protein